MENIDRRRFLGTSAAIAGLTAFSFVPLSMPAFARRAPIYTGIIRGVAVGGYDPVAYFEQGKPVKGDKAITHKHEGATWRFASIENLEAFKADPDAYAPQYGGYCAWAVSQGYTAKGDPHAWKIYDGKLYLNYNKSVQRTWEGKIVRNIQRGDRNWPKVLR